MPTPFVGGSEPRVRCELPPLILHPFDVASPAGRLAGLTANDAAQIPYLEKRYSELRMLCFLGRDLDRWLSQCMESASADPRLADAGTTESAFITQLLFDPPIEVTRKFANWGVSNFQIILSRALGLNLVYGFPPEPHQVTEALLRDFHLYADALFDIRLKKESAAAAGFSFAFEVYASSEYSEKLERAWTAEG